MRAQAHAAINTPIILPRDRWADQRNREIRRSNQWWQQVITEQKERGDNCAIDARAADAWAAL